MAVLFDQFGRAIQASDRKTPETRELAVAAIRDRWSDYPSDGLTPLRLAGIFKEADQGDPARQAELFEEIEEKDPHIASQFQTRKLAVQGISHEIQPTGEDAAAKKIALFCEEAIEALIDWDDILLDILDALPKGYSMTEILWDVSSGEASIRNLRHVHAKKVTFRDSMTPRVLTEEDPIRGVDPPPFKFLYHRYKARSGYDTRAGILRVCSWMYLFKNYGIKDWSVFSEVYGMPLRVGKYEPGASREDKDALIRAVQSLGTDAAGIISKATEIEFVEAQKTGSLNVYESLVAFCDAQVSKAILGQTLTSEAGGSKGQGSYALGQVHGEVRQDLVEADCKALGRTLTHQLLRPLVGFNFGWDAPVPKLKFLYEPPEDLVQAADVHQKLWAMNFPLSQEYMSGRFNVPLPKTGETPLDRQGGAQAAPQTLQTAKYIAKSMPTDPSQAAIDSLAESLWDEDVMDPLLKPVLGVIERATSYEEIVSALYGSYGHMDRSRLESLVERAVFMAGAWGYLKAREESWR